MTEVLAPFPVVDVQAANLGDPKPASKLDGSQIGRAMWEAKMVDPDTGTPEITSNLQAGVAAASVAIKNTVEPLDNALEETPYREPAYAKPDTTSAVFPEGDDPYGPHTISENQYHNRLNWRLGQVGKFLDANKPESPKDSDYKDWLQFKREVGEVKGDTNPYTQVDEVIGIENRVANRF